MVLKWYFITLSLIRERAGGKRAGADFAVSAPFLASSRLYDVIISTLPSAEHVILSFFQYILCLCYGKTPRF
jgi:hypothetical protein